MNDSLSKAISVALTGGIFGRGLRYGLTFVIAHGLGPQALGIFSFGLVVVKAGSVISRLGLQNAAQKYVSIYDSNDDTAGVSGVVVVCLVSSAVTGTLVATGIFLSGDLIERYVGTSLSGTIYPFLAGIPLFATMMIGMAATRGLKETKYSVYIRDVGQSVLVFGFALVGSYVASSLATIIWGYVFSLLVGCVLALYFLFRQNALSFSVRPRLEVKKLYLYSLPLLFATVTQYLISWTDILMLGVFESADTIGTYQVAFQTTLMLTILLQSASWIYPAVAADFYHNSKITRLGRLHTALTKWITYVTVLGCLFVITYSEEILQVFGSEFLVAEETLIILAVGQTVSTATGPVSYLLSMTEYEKLELLNTSIVSLLNVGLNYVLIQRWGIVGAAVATATSLSILNVVRATEVWWLVDIQPYSRRYWKGVVGILVTLPILVVGKYSGIPDLVTVLLFGPAVLLVFFVVVTLLGYDEEDRLLIESIQ